MDPILETLADPVNWLVIAGAATQMTAHLARGQIVLRAILLAGTSFYAAFYALVPGGPLWPAILSSCAIGAAGVVGLLRVLAARSRSRRGRLGGIPMPATAEAPLGSENGACMRAA